MKKISVVFCIFLNLLFFKASSEDINRIIAKVNNEIITQKDLEDFFKLLKYRLTEDFSEDISSQGDLKKQALQKLIDDRLILDQAKKEKIQVPAYLIDSKIKEIISNFDSREEFEESLIERGLNITRLRQKIEEQFLIRQVLEKYVAQYVSISPQEVLDFYNKNPNLFISSAEFLIWIATQKDKDKLIEIGNCIKKEGIDSAAEKYKDKLVNLKANKESLKDEISKILEGLKENTFTIKRIENLYYLIYLQKIESAKQLSFEEAKELAYNYLYNLKFKERYNNWISQIKKKALIKIYE